MSRAFLNDPADVVAEMLDGIVLATPDIDRIASRNVLVTARRDRSLVAVISGGGSGHEPAAAGYLGAGALTACACGDVYASPSVDAVLAAIRCVTSDAGALLVVMNYTGDRLNFGLAAERAKLEGYAVETVVVSDDCALAEGEVGIAGRRGLAGTVFVHKVAGAAAAAGKSLREVAAEAKACADAVGTMGVATRACTLPGANGVAREIANGRMELGLGIHGEPGAETVEAKGCDEVVGTLLERIFERNATLGKLGPGSKVGVMVNSLGSTPMMELYVAARAARAWLVGVKQARVTRAYVGTFMSAIDMRGFSITVVSLDDDGRVARLDAPCSCPAWPKDARTTPGQLIVVEGPKQDPEAATKSRSAGSEPKTAEGAAAEKAIKRVAKELIAIEEELTKYDTAVGDGDCGVTIRKGAEALLKDVETYPVDDAAELARALGETVRRSMGGTSGALYDIFFTAAAEKLKKIAKGKAPGAEVVCVAFITGVHSMMQYGGARGGDRTMLDALVPASTMASVSAMAKNSGVSIAVEAAKAAKTGAMDTKNMRARAGRSSYVNPEVLKDTPDPGAVAAATWLQAVADSLS